jgi:hypothetical protein
VWGQRRWTYRYVDVTVPAFGMLPRAAIGGDRLRTLPERPRPVAGRRSIRDGRNVWLTHRVAAINLHRLVNLGLTHRTDRWYIG